MTSFVAWVGVDSRGPASLYLASDSCVSWGAAATWDCGRKLFASKNHPDLLGYVGDVLFPSLALSQVTAAIDADALYPQGSRADERFSLIRETVRSTFDKLPPCGRHHFTVVYATREHEGMRSRFHIWVLAWRAAAGWAERDISIPTTSSSLWISGSGVQSIHEWQARWNSSSQGRTSRAVFGAFCDAIHSRSDPLTGGAPQLVGLYRTGPARTIGVVFGGKPHLFGLPLPRYAEAQALALEWRNALFERCDAMGNPLPAAQKHHAPRGLAKSHPKDPG